MTGSGWTHKGWQERLKIACWTHTGCINALILSFIHTSSLTTSSFISQVELRPERHLVEKDNCPSYCLNVLKWVKQDFTMVHPGRRHIWDGVEDFGRWGCCAVPHNFKGSDLVLMARISLRSGKHWGAQEVCYHKRLEDKPEWDLQRGRAPRSWWLQLYWCVSTDGWR